MTEKNEKETMTNEKEECISRSEYLYLLRKEKVCGLDKADYYDIMQYERVHHRGSK